MNDWELIQNYCRTGSENSFETLVKRHVDYVYSAALRQVRDPSLAEDVSQAVFMLLAQKAKSFRPDTVLVSWLFRTTHYIAIRALRSEFRRQRRELEASKMNPTITTPESDEQWERVSPVLDEALATLPNKDRDAVLLRFIGRKPFSEVGAEIGASEDAAKKRVTRALARLRDFFTQRGTTLSVAVIAVMLGERLVQASPVALTAKITLAAGTGSAGAASASATALLKTTLRELFWTKVRWGTAISAGVVAVLFCARLATQRVHGEAALSTPLASAAQGQASIGSNRSTADDASTNQTGTNQILRLLVQRAEDQHPIARTRILADRYTGTQKERILDATTDSNGMLNIPIPTNEFSLLVVWVSAEDRVPKQMKWHPYEFNEPAIPYTMLLERGQTASGTVLDESGEPIPGAKITLNSWMAGGVPEMREQQAFDYETSALFTDANGRWATTQLPPESTNTGVNVLVTSPDYTAAYSDVTRLPGFPTNGLIILSNGVALGGRITDRVGKPVLNARVSKQSGNGYLRTRTDADGRFFWPHVEPGKVFVDVEAKGFETLHDFAWATNSANECAFTLTPASNSVPPVTGWVAPRFRLHGTVVDAETGKPIPSFRVMIGSILPAPNWDAEAILPGAGLLGEGHDGRFDWKDVPSEGVDRLQIEAEGYLTSASQKWDYNEAEHEFNFKLRRPTILTGRVVTPDGSPAENAVVSLTGPNMGPTMQRPGELIGANPGFETTRTRTDASGRFRLTLKAGARGVAVVHESGSVLVTFAAATNDAIVLRPWGVVDGSLYLAGRPAPDQTVSVNGIQKLDVNPLVMFSFSYRTNTDEHGHFRFDKVLPCEVSIERWVGVSDSAPSLVNPDLTTRVMVESGAIASVELRRQGRPVIGRIVFQGSSSDVYWGTSTAVLQSGSAGFPFALGKDGAMRADDVPPGTYKLSIELKSATADPQLDEKTFGSLQKEVVIRSAQDESAPVDLGQLDIQRAK